MGRKFQPKKDVPLTQRKVSHKGKACRRGQPVYYDEVKQRINLMLTPYALDRLERLAEQQECSKSEVIERWLRTQ